MLPKRVLNSAAALFIFLNKRAVALFPHKAVFRTQPPDTLIMCPQEGEIFLLITGGIKGFTKIDDTAPGVKTAQDQWYFSLESDVVEARF